MTDLKQYCLRLALALPPGFTLGLVFLRVPDFFFSELTVIELIRFSFFCLLGSSLLTLVLYLALLNLHANDDVLAPASEEEMKARRPMRWVGVGMLLIPLINLLHDTKSAAEAIAVVVSYLAAVAITAFFLWMIFGKWLKKEVAIRRALLGQQGAMPTNGEALSS